MSISLDKNILSKKEKELKETLTTSLNKMQKNAKAYIHYIIQQNQISGPYNQNKCKIIRYIPHSKKEVDTKS